MHYSIETWDTGVLILGLLELEDSCRQPLRQCNWNLQLLQVYGNKSERLKKLAKHL